jgi:signal peptidase I
VAAASKDGGSAIEDVTSRTSASQPRERGDPAALPVVEALAIGWQVAELAAAVADDQVPITGQVLVARPLARTVGHRLRQLDLRDRSGSAVSADELSALVSAPDVDRATVLRAVLALHAATLEGLASASAPGRADLRHGYELGKALAQSSLVALLAAQTGQPSLYRRLFDSARLQTVVRWLAGLRDELPDLAAEAVFWSVRSWCIYVARASDEDLEASGPALRSQSRIWRDLLLGRQGASALTAPAGAGGGAAAASALEATEAASLEAAFSGAGGELAAAGGGSALLLAATVLPPGAAAVLMQAPPTLPPPPAGPPAPPPTPPSEGATVLPGPPEAAAAEPDAGGLPAPEAAGQEGNGPAGGPSAQRRRDRFAAAHPWWHRLAGWALVLVLALAITVALRTFVVQPFSIPSGSMFPTLQVGDRILVDKLPPAVDTIHLGDIIVFRRVASDRVDPGTQDLVKRVVGLPGQTISSRGDEVVLDGRPLAEPWLPALTGDCTQPGNQLDIRRQTIPPHSYFVLGDCRGISYDSRYWGTVPASHVIGKVFVVVWRNDHPWFHWF